MPTRSRKLGYETRLPKELREVAKFIFDLEHAHRANLLARHPAFLSYRGRTMWQWRKMIEGDVPFFWFYENGKFYFPGG